MPAFTSRSALVWVAIITVAMYVAQLLFFHGPGPRGRSASIRDRLLAFFDQTGTADTFIPEVWSAVILTTLKKSLVYGSELVANRDYEGEIREKGDTVTVNSVGRPTIGDYDRANPNVVPERLATGQRKLRITEEKYFSFDIDDVDAAQAAGDMLKPTMVEAAYALRDVADQFLASHYTSVVSANDLGPRAILTGADAYEGLVDLSVVLDEANVPDEGRYVVVPSWYHGRLLLDDRFVANPSSKDDSSLRNGHVGEAAGFRILKSNNCPNPAGDDYVVQAGYRGALSYAEQINKTEGYRPEKSFSDAVKGLHVYGGKLMRPDAVAIMTASQTAL